MDKDTKITLKLEGQAHEIDCQADETVLEAALRNGIDAPYGCMAGTCNACQGHLSEGTVDMEYRDALSDDEIAEGEILCCQARPTTEHVCVTFTD